MKSADHTERFVQFAQRAVTAEALANRNTHAHLWALAARPHDDRLLRTVDHQISRCEYRQQICPDPFGGHRVLEDGPLTWGRMPWGPYRTSIDLLTRHALVVGESGSGKTTLLCGLLLSILAFACAFQRTIGAWVFEFRRRQFRRLRPRLLRQGIDLLVVRGPQIVLNPLEPPPGVGPARWGHVAADLLIQSLDLPPASRFILRQTIFECYRRRGVLEGGQDYPTLAVIFESVSTLRDGHPQSRAAILEKLGSLLSTAGTSFRHQRGWRIDALARRAIVWELDELSFAAQNIVVLYLMLGLFYHQMFGRNVVNAPLETAVFVDEAQRLYSQRFEISYGSGPTPLAEATAQCRSAGIGLICGAQMVHDLSRPLLANTTTKVLGATGTSDDLHAMGSHMGLNRAQLALAKYALRPGYMVIQKNEGVDRWPRLIGTPNVPLKDIVDDLEAARSAEVLGALGSPDGSGQTSPALAIMESTCANGLTPDERSFLCAIRDNPGRPATEYAKLAGFSLKKSIRLRARLVRAGLLRDHRISGPRGGRCILLELLPTAHTALGWHEPEACER